MVRPAYSPRSHCAARFATALALCAAALATISAITLADDSIGRFPARAVPVADPVPPPVPTIVNSRMAAPSPMPARPLMIDSADVEHYGWPDEAQCASDFDIAPPSCACPDCGGHGCRRCRSWLHGFSGWNEHGEYFTHNNPDDPARHVGKGEPLYGTSWLNRPHYTGVLLGGVITSGPLHPWAEHENSGLVSIYQGYDFDHFWGGEMRFAFGRFGLAGNGPESENDVFYIDAHLAYYPWGDARWRPYLSAGVGFMSNDFIDTRGIEFDELLLTIPLSAGVKYQMQPHCAIRFDLSQNISIGSGSLETMDNISLSAGVEWRYGGARKSYFPWNAGVYEH